MISSSRSAIHLNYISAVTGATAQHDIRRVRRSDVGELVVCGGGGGLGVRSRSSIFGNTTTALSASAAAAATSTALGSHRTNSAEEDGDSTRSTEWRFGWLRGQKHGQRLAQVANALKLAAPHAVMLSTTTAYILLGALLFVSIEGPHELAHRRDFVRRIRSIEQQLLDERSLDVANYEAIVERLTATTFEAFAAGIRPNDLLAEDGNDGEAGVNGSMVAYRKWTVPSAIFFTTTVLTSIGYGHLVPVSAWGQAVLMLYAMLGIPLTLVTIADVAKFFSDLLGGIGNEKETGELDAPVSGYKRMGVLLLLLSYMAISALMFTYLEQSWSLVDAFYFTVISLLTVGLGDLHTVGGMEYMLGCILFIFVGLVLTTFAVDVIGSACIDKLHALGRGLNSLSASSFLKVIRKQHKTEGDEDNYWWAYVPLDAHTIPYIDAAPVPSTSSSSAPASAKSSQQLV